MAIDIKDIKQVELVHYPEVKEGEMQDGLPKAPHPEFFSFRVDLKGVDDEIIVPNDPLNADYNVVREWHGAQKTAPFKFAFAEIVEADEDETEVDDGEGVTLAADQSKDAKLPDTNLTREQKAEIRARETRDKTSKE